MPVTLNGQSTAIKQNKTQITATIANGASLSGSVNLLNMTPVGIQMPAAWTAADLTFQASYDNSTFVNVYDDAGNEYTVTVSTDQYVILDPADFSGARYIKVRSGTAAAAQNQGAERAIILVVREV